MGKPQVIFCLGLPGAGKGTQCGLIEDKCGFHHISAGDCLREEQNNEGSEYGDLIKECIVLGKIVPVEITCRLLKNKMKKLGWENGKFIIDGFPRNQDNLEGWIKETDGEVDVVGCLLFDCPEEVVTRRLLARAQTSGRDDDNIESMRKRFVVFQEQTIPIVDYFEKQGKVLKVNGDRPVEDVWRDVQRLDCLAPEGGTSAPLHAS